MIPLAAHMGYYAAAAQVIPVLMLVLFLGESRFFGTGRDYGAMGVTFSLFAMFVLFVGELAALRTLSRGEDSGALWLGTTLGLGYGLIFVFQSALHKFLIEDQELSPGRRRGLMRLFLVVAIAGAVAATVVLVPSY